MVVGTSSHVGKSLITTALCRVMSRKGWRVTPFRGQAYSTDTYTTASGAEINYSQAVQAWAAGVTPTLEMNPVLLKENSAREIQVLLRGQSVATLGQFSDFDQYSDRGWRVILECLRALDQNFDLLIAEGAGSPAEVHNSRLDLSNMRLAIHLNAQTVLVAEGDRGGTLAHIVGTLDLLPPEARRLIRGIVINKAKPPLEAWKPAVKWLEERTRLPVIGTVPPIVPASPIEDALEVLKRRSATIPLDLNLTIIRLPHITNFTDFDPLEAEASVKLNYIGPGEAIGYPDAVILPGSRATISDLAVLSKTGTAKAIQDYAQAGGTVIGICGGFQMLGTLIADPEGLEGSEGLYHGLGLLPLKTVITGQKIARQRLVSSRYPEARLPVMGFEIQHGRTMLVETHETKQKGQTYEQLFEEAGLGAVDHNLSIWGTYLHGLFDNGPWRRSWLNCLRQRRGLKALPTGVANYREHREAQLDVLADEIAAHLDIQSLMPEAFSTAPLTRD